jgi:catechol 2,3-dioxygenase-like lactoylglutathione lyase family enzyme
MLEINAITLATPAMGPSVDFWTVPGLEVVFGGRGAPFTTLGFGDNFVNLVATDQVHVGFWGRVVFHVPSPDDVHAAFVAAGYPPMTDPADAPWGERYFHILDPAGHELSFARRLVDEAESEPGSEREGSR